jgi:general nucleoside transport system permease protein
MRSRNWTIVRLPVVGPGRRSLAVIVSILLALVLSGWGLALFGFSPLLLLGSVLQEQFGSRFGLEDLGLIYAPIVFCSLSMAICIRAGLWNIGAEGQFYVGAAAATGAGLFLHATPWLMWPLMIVGAIAGGMIWMLIPALSRVYGAVDEIISTLLLNFVAVLFITYLTSGPWRDQKTFVNAASGRIPYDLPALSGALHIGIVVAVALAVLLAIVFRYSRWGYEVLMCGANAGAATYAGMPVGRRLLQVMLLSGAIAGLAGMIEIVGTVHRLQTGISSSYGYLGIIAGVLVRGSMLGVLLSAGFAATLLGATSILQAQGLSTGTALALTGTVLFFAAMGQRLAEFRIIRVAVGTENP